MQKKIICFDIDGTLIDGNSWLAITEGLNCSVAKHVQLYKDTISAKITFEYAERELVSSGVKAVKQQRKASKKFIKKGKSEMA